MNSLKFSILLFLSVLFVSTFAHSMEEKDLDRTSLKQSIKHKEIIDDENRKRLTEEALH